MNTLRWLCEDIRSWYWAFTGQCSYCGGELQEYSWKKAYCLECGKKN